MDLKNNKELAQFYNKVYIKGEKKHFTIKRESVSLSEIKEVLKQVSWKGKKVLDVGCGTGLFAFNAAKKGAIVLGVDFSTEAIQIAQSQYIHKNLKFESTDVNKIKEKFDVIVSNGTLEHMDNPLKTLRLFKKHLTKNGCIITTSPNWSNPRGYMLMPLLFLFDAPITLADLHYFTPVDFENFSKKLGMYLSWETFDKSWSHGEILIEDFKKRLPNVLRDSNLPNNKKKINSLIEWIKSNINKLNHDLPHSGATGLYVLSFKKHY
jgi:2-polyprenyl-3-methyl-5-hydroxy-6-metoxy-1,4-benzoquinol methylase